MTLGGQSQSRITRQNKDLVFMMKDAAIANLRQHGVSGTQSIMMLRKQLIRLLVQP